ncbi:mannan endo-1,6-alpha-mannosidase [Corynespora cassiicola Philippines]|uniref:Mannan endo-1,6-alpha-mannosidase n=1 Tax=Corynespora cassiicola Philippines TaxID=1448308 RepID=A0A2T2NC12_CORCC|nr:mannan endo-1,6-alpha-mannosidase [Corynespora cassiicola Philippines]
MMHARRGVLPLALSLALGSVAAIDLDVNNQDSLKTVAKTIADDIVSAYNDTIADFGPPGLFPDPYYWYEAGIFWQALIEYSHITGDSNYDATISTALQWQTGDFDAFMPVNQTKSLSNDEQSIWGLAALAAAESGLSKPENVTWEWEDLAANVFDVQTARWHSGDNATCGGGLRWQIFSFNRGYDYMNSASVGNFFLLSARLARFTGNSTYSEWADRSYQWSRTVGLVSDDFEVFDGASANENCESINQLRWTADHALYTEGAAIMYNLTNGNETWNSIVQGFVDASSFFKDNDTSALIEAACENDGTCASDLTSSKGQAIRAFSRAAIAAPFIADSIHEIVESSAKAAAENCREGDEGVECRFSWGGEDRWEMGTVEGGKLGPIMNAMQAVQALLLPQAGALQNESSNGTSGSGTSNPNATESGSAGGPSETGAANTIASSLTFAVAIAFAVALST